MRWQLRDFRIVPGALDQFAAEWRETVAPARVAAGFSIVGPWLVPAESRFIWILGYDGGLSTPNVSPMCSVQSVTHVPTRSDLA